MSTPTHPETVPLNDTNDAKGLMPDPQLEAVERRENDARDLGLPQDEAQARAWADVDDDGDAKQGTGTSGHDDPPPADISIGG